MTVLKTSKGGLIGSMLKQYSCLLTSLVYPIATLDYLISLVSIYTNYTQKIYLVRVNVGIVRKVVKI